MLIQKDQSNKYTLQLPDGATDKYPSIVLTDNDGDPVEILQLTHESKGQYIADYTYSGTSKKLTGQGIVYSDELRTTEDTSYEFGEETYNVVNDISAEDVRIELDANSTMFALLVKLCRNAHKVTPTGGTLYIYDGDDDQAAVLEEYELYDANGVRSSDNFTYMKRVTA